MGFIAYYQRKSSKLKSVSLDTSYGSNPNISRANSIIEDNNTGEDVPQLTEDTATSNTASVPATSSGSSSANESS
eukprot:gnl/Chilomastix_caulleri/1972.p1 GENE.gnl/Chilomastix_caulleri/1972~~gnl/Chilomastix_caulleri/1972.p1  ORF type:complete len:75 (+),score=26.10 gnl/Chilomastix_caulleri/1972:80-304(+)